MSGLKTLHLTILLLLTVSALTAQKIQEQYAVMTYNVENLFDTKDDPLTNDEEFTPNGDYHWTYYRLRKKLGQIARVIATSNSWNPPAIVALCEVENDDVLRNLVYGSPLKNLRYNFIHFDSPDPRGIDVALLYRKDRFTPINARAIAASDTARERRTRDILYVSGIIASDTLHIFVCHFPSRLGGEAASEPRRIEAAYRLRATVDSVFSTNAQAKIIIMGDFNDYPYNRSISEILKAQAPHPSPQDGELYDLCAPLQHADTIGSHKFQNQWGMLDHIIVSGSLLNSQTLLTTQAENIRIFSPDWLLEGDDVHSRKPKRTFLGQSYHGGYSDHLPVLLEILNNVKQQIP